MHVIAVEENLSNVSRALREAGYEVRDLQADNLEDATAVIVSGVDNDVLQFQDVQTWAPVISAEGRTPEEIIEELRKRII